MSLPATITPVFNKKSYPIPIEMRPLWRISLIVISIALVSKPKPYLDLAKVNILVWMLIRKSQWNNYNDYCFGQTHTIPLVSVDTATYKAFEFALSKQLIQLENGRLSLLEAGHKLYETLVLNEIMNDERVFLSQIGKKLTEKKVTEMTGGK